MPSLSLSLSPSLSLLSLSILRTSFNLIVTSFFVCATHFIMPSLPRPPIYADEIFPDDQRLRTETIDDTQNHGQRQCKVKGGIYSQRSFSTLILNTFLSVSKPPRSIPIIKMQKRRFRYRTVIFLSFRVGTFFTRVMGWPKSAGREQNIPPPHFAPPPLATRN